MAKYESELYDEDYFNHDHDHGYTSEQLEDEPPIFNEGAEDKITEDMSIYYEKVFEQNEGESLLHKLKHAFNVIKDNIKHFPSKLWTNIKSIPSRVIFGDNKGFGIKMAKEELEQDKRKNVIKNKGKDNINEIQNKDIKDKAKVNNRNEKENNNKISQIIPNVAAFMNDKIHNKEYISGKDLDTLDDLFMKDLVNGTKESIAIIESQTKDLNTLDFKLQKAVHLANSKTLNLMSEAEHRVVDSIPTLSNRYYEIKKDIAENLHSLNETINRYNKVIDKLNNFDSDKLPEECTGSFANGDRRAIYFEFDHINDDDIIIDNDTYTNFKNNLFEIDLNKEVNQYLVDTNLAQNVNIKDVFEKQNNFNEIEPSEELKSFVTEEVEISEDKTIEIVKEPNIDNVEENYETETIDDYETIEEAEQKMESEKFIPITPETYEDFER